MDIKSILQYPRFAFVMLGEQVFGSGLRHKIMVGQFMSMNLRSCLKSKIRKYVYVRW